MSEMSDARKNTAQIHQHYLVQTVNIEQMLCFIICENQQDLEDSGILELVILAVCLV